MPDVREAPGAGAGAGRRGGFGEKGAGRRRPFPRVRWERDPPAEGRDRFP